MVEYSMSNEQQIAQQHDLERHILSGLAKQESASEEQKYFVSWVEMEGCFNSTDRAILGAWAMAFAASNNLYPSPQRDIIQEWQGIWFVPIYDPVLWK